MARPEYSGSIVSFRRGRAAGATLRKRWLGHAIVRGAGACGVLAGGRDLRAEPGQSKRGERSGTQGLGRVARRRGMSAASHAPGKGGENDAEAGSGLRAAHRRRDLLPADWRCPSGVPSLLRADSPCPAGVRACSFYFLRVLRGAFHKTKPAFGRKAGRAFREDSRTTKEMSWPVRGR